MTWFNHALNHLLSHINWKFRFKLRFNSRGGIQDGRHISHISEMICIEASLILRRLPFSQCGVPCIQCRTRYKPLWDFWNYYATRSTWVPCVLPTRRGTWWNWVGNTPNTRVERAAYCHLRKSSNRDSLGAKALLAVSRKQRYPSVLIWLQTTP